ncbi:hypothetical protein OAV19_00335 [bacterium]|nr:hypothetical protein [bacterium]
MIERLFTNIKTTIVGLIIFVTGAMLVAFNKATLTEFGAFIGVAFALFFSKDPKQTTK